MKKKGVLYVAAGSEDGRLKLWRTTIDKEGLQEVALLTARPHVKNVAGLDFSPAGDYLVTAGWDGSAKGMPLPAEFLDRDYAKILDKLERRTGLGLSGFRLTFGERTSKSNW
jgi:hypothetical protein